MLLVIENKKHIANTVLVLTKRPLMCVVQTLGGAEHVTKEVRPIKIGAVIFSGSQEM